MRPGDPKAPAACLNPLEPEEGFPLQTHVDLVRDLFLAAFEADEPFPQVLSEALTTAYTDLGWDLVFGEPVRGYPIRYPTLGDLQRTARRIVDTIGYGQEVRNNIRGFIEIRLRSLRFGTPGRFLEGGHPVDVGEMLNRNVVVELEDVGSDQDKAFLMGTLLIRIYEYLRLTAPDPPSRLRHVTVIEEAHRLLKRIDGRGAAAHAVEMFAGLLAEIRAYGEGLIVAEQIPTKIIPDVCKNTSLKIMHRLPAADDREFVGATMNLGEEQSSYVVGLRQGWAAVFTDGMDAPLLVSIDGSGAARDCRDRAVHAVPLRACRSVACGEQCTTRPCTLGELQLGRNLLAVKPLLRIWVEASIVSHGVGAVMPRPGRDWLESLRGLDRRTVECALGQAIDAAVGSRYAALAEFYSPDALAGHLAASASTILWRQRGGPGCAEGEVEWQAGRHRFVDVLAALKAASNGPADRHPDTDRWLARGVPIPDAPAAEQQQALRSHRTSRYPRQKNLDWGVDEPAALRLALEELAPNWRLRVQLAMAMNRLGAGTSKVVDWLAPEPTQKADSG